MEPVHLPEAKRNQAVFRRLSLQRKEIQMFSLNDKTILVTGAAGGIGTAMCKVMADLGAKVALTDLEDSTGREVAADLGHNVSFYPMDVTDSDDIEKTMDRVEADLGPLSGVVANAGIAPTGPTM